MERNFVKHLISIGEYSKQVLQNLLGPHHYHHHHHHYYGVVLACISHDPLLNNSKKILLRTSLFSESKPSVVTCLLCDLSKNNYCLWALELSLENGSKSHCTELLRGLTERTWDKCLAACQPSIMDLVTINFVPQGYLETHCKLMKNRTTVHRLWVSLKTPCPTGICKTRIKERSKIVV